MKNAVTLSSIEAESRLVVAPIGCVPLAIVPLGGNPVTWLNKMQRVVTRSSIEAEYRSMAHTTLGMLWVCSLLQDTVIDIPTLM